MTDRPPGWLPTPWRLWALRFALLLGLLASVAYAQAPLWLIAPLVGLVLVPLRSAAAPAQATPATAPLAAFTREVSRSTSANAVAAAGVAWAVKQMATRAQSQAQAAQQVVDDAQAMIATVQHTDTLSGHARPAAEQMLADGLAGHATLEVAMASMQQLSQYAATSRESIAVLGQLGDGIARVAGSIASIAAQTNLLALNAAIEAARAGEHGRGFAVVADEVRALAGRTARATAEVGQMVEQIQQRTGEVVGQIDVLARDLVQGVTQVGEAGSMMTRIAGQASAVANQVGEIALGASRNLERLASLFQAIDGMREDLTANEARISQLGQAAGQLERQAETLSERLAEGGLDDYHQRIYMLACEGAQAIGQRFEDDIATGVITEQALFDRTLRAIAGTHPLKYESAFDRYTDQVLPALQEPLLARHEGLVFAIACTPQGYVPTHNRAFSAAPCGEFEKDMAMSRSKRVFDDPTGIRCGSHRQALLLQTYCRDTGELMHDLSVPIQCGGKHWGGLRLGYRPQD